MGRVLSLAKDKQKNIVDKMKIKRRNKRTLKELELNVKIRNKSVLMTFNDFKWSFKLKSVLLLNIVVIFIYLGINIVSPVVQDEKIETSIPLTIMYPTNLKTMNYYNIQRDKRQSSIMGYEIVASLKEQDYSISQINTIMKQINYDYLRDYKVAGLKYLKLILVLFIFSLILLLFKKTRVFATYVLFIDMTFLFLILSML